MNPLATILAALVSLKNDLYTKFNAALSKLPPLEQMEGGNAALPVIRELDWAKERMERVGADLDSALIAASNIVQGFERKANESVDVAATRLIDMMNEQAGKDAISAAIAAKTHLPIEDHNTALASAVDTAKAETKNEVEVQFNAKLQSIQTLSERRATVTEKLGALAASTIADADLLADDHEVRITAVEDRVALLTAAGITPEAKPKGFESLMACGYDEAGLKEFGSRMEMIKESAGAPLAASAPKPSPETPAGVLQTGNADKKKPVI